MLDTIAQLAAAFAGFAGIVIALAGRTRHDWPARERNGVRVILQSTLGSVFFAMLPHLTEFVLEQPTAWRVAAAPFVVYHGVILTWAVRAARSIRDTHRGSSMMRAPIIYASFAAGLVLVLALAGAALFGQVRWLEFWYVANLLWLLIVSVWIFAALVLDSIPERGADT